MGSLRGDLEPGICTSGWTLTQLCSGSPITPVLGMLPPPLSDLRFKSNDVAFAWTEGLTPSASVHGLLSRLVLKLQLPPTCEVAVHLQVAHDQPEDGELVKSGSHILREGQQAAEFAQFLIEVVPVSFRRVGLSTLWRLWPRMCGKGKVIIFPSSSAIYFKKQTNKQFLLECS